MIRFRTLLLLTTLLAPAGVMAQQPSPQAAQPPAPEAKTKPERKAKPERKSAAEIPSAPVDGANLDSVVLHGLPARGIGPAVMGGRVSDIALDPKKPSTFYVALGTGGLMKSADAGATFQAIFEHEGVAAVGAVAVSPSAPGVVWVGTGEANDRNSSGWGDGVYRSTDGGGTWTNVGLRESRTVARIAPHPTDSNTAYVAAMGDLWGPSGGRGLFKTTDGGGTWKAVLTAPAPYADKVGCGDVVLDPTDPNIVYAALYARERRPWAFVAGPPHTDGKDVGGIFKSTDGGASWKKLTGGLPTGTGRIGLAIYPKNPKIVYAVVQSDEAGTASIDDIRSKAGGVYRSENGGESWTRMNPLNPRPFYFSQIRVDPNDDKRVFVLGFAVHTSTDGGRTFREDHFKNVHPDNHALAIDPTNSSRLLLGTDGGVYQSYDGGGGWSLLNRFAAGEFYRIAVDSSNPYRVCGGLQDNQSWVGPNRTRSKAGVRNEDWIPLGGGDGFYCAFDAGDPDVIYAESQEGTLFRMDLRTGESEDLRPSAPEGQPGFRYNWNSPLLASRHTPGVLYLGGDRVFRLTERGKLWKAISPDLSTHDYQKALTAGSGAENFGVVYALEESPITAGLLWAGTDDGKLWVTETDGNSWTDLSANLPAPGKGHWISRVEPGHVDAKVAYVAIDAHRSQNYAPLLYRTADGGKSWQSVSGDLPKAGPVKVVREDPVNPNLLFAGTEFGLFASTNRGGHWFRLGNLPTVAVDDIVIQPTERDLVIATHGRSIFVLDDITPLEELTPAAQQEPAHLFTPRATHGTYPLPSWLESEGNGVYRGQNPPDGALLTYYVRQYTGETVSLSIADSAGRTVANLTGPGTPGFSRVAWDLKPTSDLMTAYGGQAPRLVPSGKYKVTMSYGKLKQEQTLEIRTAEGMETW